MARISETEFYNDKDVITQIEWLKDHIGGARLEDVQLRQDTTIGSPTYGRVTMTFTMESGEVYERYFDNVAVTSITSEQVGDLLNITFHLANGQTYTVSCVITTHATVAWESITGTPSSSTPLTNRINELAQAKADAEKTRAEGAETALGNRLTAAEGAITSMANTLIGILYPVGSLYFGTNDTNPGSFITGTTWELFSKGKCIIGLNPDDADYSVCGATGGSKTRTLTTSQMPSHNHTISNSGTHTHSGSTAMSGSHAHQIGISNSGKGAVDLASGSVVKNDNEMFTATTGSHFHSFTTNEDGSHNHSCSNSGNGNPIDIRDPYIVVAIWKRTA